VPIGSGHAYCRTADGGAKVTGLVKNMGRRVGHVALVTSNPIRWGTPLIPAVPATDKMTRHRQRLRAAGLRPVQFWVADTRQPALAARLREQCRRLQGDVAEN
jgi:hypothetical protein